MDCKLPTLPEPLGYAQQVPGVLSIQLAPDGIVAYLTNVDRNRQAIGHDLLKDSARRDQVLETIRQRGALVAGPLELKQGRVVSCFQRIIYGLRRRIISHPFGINVLSEYRRPSHYIAQQRVLMVLSLGLEFQLIRPKMGMF